MDISTLDIYDIELFGMAHDAAKHVFGVAPTQATARKQKKIRKWVRKTYVDGNTLSEKTLSFVDLTRTDAEFMGFLAACADHMQERDALKRQLFEKATVDFPEDVKKAFHHLFDLAETCETVTVQADKVLFSLDETDCYKRTLILHTTQEAALGNFDMLVFSDAQILKEEGGYKLICVAENFTEETSWPVSIYFDHATTEIPIYRADQRDFYESPWESLSLMAVDILEKSYLGDGYFNDKERALLPLLRELQVLSFWGAIYREENQSFENLKQYVRKHNQMQLIPLLDKVASSKKPFSPFLMGQLSSKLNAAACEKLWRELYDLVVDTQEGYAEKALLYGERKLKRIQQEIEKKLHDLGYAGNYPTFYKKGQIKGLCLEESYNQSYFVWREKNVDHLIRCRAFWDGDSLTMQFICATAILKKNETITDAYSCCFHQNGRRFFKLLSWDAKDRALLEQFVTIAAKKAECTKLSKEEKQLLGTGNVSLRYMIAMFLFTGGLFAILMTAAAFLVLCLVTAIIDGFGGIPEMILQMPWWLFFTISFVGFGVPMVFVDVKAKTK